MENKNLSQNKIPFDQQRAYDLLRYCRHQLFTDGLITPDEFADLVFMDGSVKRLESYDMVLSNALRFIENTRRLLRTFLSPGLVEGVITDLKTEKYENS